MARRKATRGRRRKAARIKPRQPMSRPARALVEAALCAVFVAAVIAAFCWFAFGPDRYRVRTVRVEGAVVLDEEAIIARSGITNGDSIFRVNSAAIAQRIAEMPRVDGCRVTRMFPDKVIITIRERMAIATLLVNNRSFELDRQCNVLAELGAHDEPVGPFVTDVTDQAPVAPGDRLVGRPLRGAVAVWEAFRATTMARDVTVSEICARSESRILMYCDEVDCEIRWGRDGVAGQARKLDLLWNGQNGRIPCQEYVDLRFGDDVVCR